MFTTSLVNGDTELFVEIRNSLKVILVDQYKEDKMEIENILIKTEYLDVEDCNIVKDESDGENEEVEISNKKPYKCGICGHRTTTDTLLKVHMKMHLVKRVHQCNTCNRTFNFVTELNSHILTHTEVKSNFQCEICHRDCFTEEDLQRHYRVHTKEKPFKCKLCFRCFSDDSYLRVHERSHHGEDYLKKTMKKDGTYVDPCLVQNLNEDCTPQVSVSVQKTAPPKKFKNDPNLPLNDEEKLLLLQNIEKLGLNKKYHQLDQIKSYLKNNWLKMGESFAEQDFNRNPEKLSRTYFHLKNQAKTHIERFYKHKKLPEPREIDYMCARLCPAEFQIPGVDIEKVLKDGKKYAGRQGWPEVNQNGLTIEEDDKDEEEVDPLLQLRLSGSSHYSTTVNPEAPSCSRKRTLSESEDDTASKKSKTEDECIVNEINRLKLKFLLAEEQRKNHLYRIELKEKQEFFNMEKKHRQEIYQKELEIKNLELTLLRQKTHR